MEIIKNFFSKENALLLYSRFYSWLEGILTDIFGSFPYGPLRELFLNPLFWIIIAALIILGLIFRKR